MVNNTTLLVLSDSDTTLALALVFGFILMGIGFKRSEFLFLAGPVWIISGLLIFIDYGVVFLSASVCLGIVLMMQGAMSYAK